MQLTKSWIQGRKCAAIRGYVPPPQRHRISFKLEVANVKNEMFVSRQCQQTHRPIKFYVLTPPPNNILCFYFTTLFYEKSTSLNVKYATPQSVSIMSKPNGALTLCLWNGGNGLCLLYRTFLTNRWGMHIVYVNGVIPKLRIPSGMNFGNFPSHSWNWFRGVEIRLIIILVGHVIIWVR